MSADLLTDTRLADAAWFAMDVPCWKKVCDVAATWRVDQPCGDHRLLCAEHNIEDQAGAAAHATTRCPMCDRSFWSADCTWSPL
jgi:hypothetical protein